VHERCCCVKSCGKISLYAASEQNRKIKAMHLDLSAISRERELNARRLRRENKNEYFESIYYTRQRQVLNEPEEIMICEEGFFTPLTVFTLLFLSRFFRGACI
jgi:hypothetical protein